jgi:putative restriction endonuclease
MAKAVLTTKVDPSYDDLPEVRYHFPSTYLRQISAAKGDWIVYYEPRRVNSDEASRGGRSAYFATARIKAIEPDPARSDHYYARMEYFLPFDRAVSFRRGKLTYEHGLTKDDGSTNKGAFGRAVRNLSEAEYDLILHSGFTRTLADIPLGAIQRDAPASFGFSDQEQAIFDRPLVERLVVRPFREAAFAGAVKTAYGDTCAMTGLKIVNGGGRTEVQAAHIRPVADSGPDSVRNGLALSGTVHWMFDRGLVSINDDYSLLVASGGVPDTIGRLLNPDRRLRLPQSAELRPHPQFLRYHRDNVFKG